VGALTLTGISDAVEVAADGLELARYVFRPGTPADESPRPYLHPVRTLSGAAVTDFRPADHLWHHGVSLALPYVGDANLWGGRTWDSGRRDYVDLGNNGRMRHDTIALIDEAGGPPGFVEALTWLTATEVPLARERRTLSFWADADAWGLAWHSEITNATGQPLAFGSPATHGREGAGYGGIFLRAAPGFGTAEVRTGHRRAAPGERMLGEVADWMELSTGGEHPVTMRMSTGGAAAPWFVRTEEYPGFGPAPFFSEETVLLPEATLELRCELVFSDGQRPADSTG
jgi:hypothetical protein